MCLEQSDPHISYHLGHFTQKIFLLLQLLSRLRGVISAHSKSFHLHCLSFSLYFSHLVNFLHIIQKCFSYIESCLYHISCVKADIFIQMENHGIVRVHQMVKASRILQMMEEQNESVVVGVVRMACVSFQDTPASPTGAEQF